MKLADHLSKEQHEKLDKYKRNKKSKTEHIDWHDLMGVNRDTYKRGPGGAYRRKRG